MSLTVLNEDKDVSDDYRAKIARSIEVVRVVAAAQQKYGDHVVGPLYTELGTRLHNQGLIDQPGRLPETVADSLAAAGLDVALAEVMESDEYDEVVRESHHAGIGLVGQEVGTPVIAVEGTAFFGPVLSRIPRGEEAGRLWDGVLTVAGYEFFYEIKRSRTAEPAFD